MAKAKDVRYMEQWGKENKVVKRLIDKGAQPSLFYTDSYYPSNANWGYQFGICKIGSKYYELLTRFGAVEGGREIYMPDHKVNGERK